MMHLQGHAMARKLTKAILFLFIFLTTFRVGGQIVLDSKTINKSVADQAVILEDPDHKLDVHDILQGDHKFEELHNPIEILDFNASRWWLKFDVTNTTKLKHFVLETGREITNKVFLYEVKGDKVVQIWKSGDGIPFEEKSYEHRGNLFFIDFYPGETKQFLLEIESDGEVVTLPLRFWEKEAFLHHDYDAQLWHGFYFGLLTLIAIIFFFFYLVLRDRSFLYYVIYVFFQMLLQFSLDGYTFQYIFPGNTFLANHIVSWSAGGAICFVVIYAMSYLKTKEHVPRFHKVFAITMGLAALSTLLSSFGGAPYEINFPIINGLSLVLTIMILWAIFSIKRRGVKVSNYFAAAFIILIIGVIVFILGNFHIVGNAEISQASLKISSALEVLALSVTMANKYRELQEEKEVAQAKMLESLEERNKLMDEMNVRLEKQVKERTAEIQHQKEELAEKNEEILDSIRYAQRIQDAILPPTELVKSVIPESFIFYRPRDIVSGDFYFIEHVETKGENAMDLALFAAADCTGHGVPGAFMSLIGNNYLVRGLSESHVNSPAEALDFLNEGVARTLRQGSQGETMRDGMDIALCGWDKIKNKLHFSGAKNPAFIIRPAKDGEADPESRNPFFSEDGKTKLIELKGDKHPIGAYAGDELEKFSNQEFDLEKGDMIYVFSDGFPDQFGGDRGKKYNYKRYKRFLMSIASLDPQEQWERLMMEFEDWKGDHEQLDDVLVIGVRV